MEPEDIIPWVVIIFVAIAGIWLTILSYMVLKRMPSREEAKKEKEPAVVKAAPEDEEAKPEE